MTTADQRLIPLPGYQLWDFAGVDGLQCAQALAGDRVTKLAPFQSLETQVGGSRCAILRLCEGNFRLGLQGESEEFEYLLQQAQVEARVWVSRCDHLSAIAVPEVAGLELLPQLATTKPPHRLVGLQSNCAVPARIDHLSVVIWRHPLLGQPAFELQAAVQDMESIKATLSSSRSL